MWINMSIRAFGFTSDLRECLVGRYRAENFENSRSSTCISLFGCRWQGDEDEERRKRARRKNRKKERDKIVCEHRLMDDETDSKSFCILRCIPDNFQKLPLYVRLL